jgi:AmmeMemoRadiSam system protein B
MPLNFREPLPALRSNLEIVLSTYNGEDVIIISDSEGIAEENIMLEAPMLRILEKLHGEHTIHSLYSELNAENEELSISAGLQELAAFIQALDEACLLESEQYFDTKNFLDSDIRPAVCAGVCYPDQVDDLRTFLDEILAMSPQRSYPANAKAILAPHIDFRVDKEIYAAPFNAIRESDFDLVIHIGTSHYGWQDQFILTTKNFETPLGLLRTDVELVEKLHEQCSVPLTRNDIAHAPEHSLEFHHLFLQHLFPRRNFTILPVLVTSFGDHVRRQKEPHQHAKVQAFMEAIKAVVHESGRKALWVVSGDLAHVGRRFGDDWDAEAMLDTLRSEDFEIMNSIVKGSARDVFSGIALNGDRRRICGLPPVWTMLHALQSTAGMNSGVALGYNQWNDAPTGSAVTFGSAAWW